MKDSRAALRYAKAILNFAKESKKDAEVKKDMQLIFNTISENKELAVVLKSPIVKSADKTKALNAIFSKVDNISLGLFKLLEENKRLDILEAVAQQYVIIYDYDKNINIATVTTAIPIDDSLEKKVKEKIKDITGEDADLENIVNPDILGGFILRVGDIQYDASISNYLNELKNEFDNSHYIPKI